MSLAQDALLQIPRRQHHLWSDLERPLSTEPALIRAALALGAAQVRSWSAQETALAHSVGDAALSRERLEDLVALIRGGHDPLGEAFCALRSPVERREHGATYTPAPIVRSMVDWARERTKPNRIIDPGCGSARFLLEAGRAFPTAALIGVEIDPLAALVARANLARAGMADRSRILLGDYRSFQEGTDGRTLYIGNPPYVRHHQIEPKWKDWLSDEAARLGLKASKLAGLHVHFFLATLRVARPGDCGVFITAAEWLDVNYGALVRALVLGRLGGQGITLIEPTAQPFPDAATTAAITTFEVASKPTSVYFRRVDSLQSLDSLDKGRRVRRERLASETRWSHLTRSVEGAREGFVELGELCRVHRGQVTGANAVWIAGKHSADLPESVLYRSITRARELFEAQGVLRNARGLRSVIDLPIDLDVFDASERRAVDQFLKVAREMGANQGYIARHRKAWWSVGLREPAPIIATYMARRPPAFVLNEAKARHINIAHGLYPRDALSYRARKTLVSYLLDNISQRSGRTYAGGLTKFEPREMERLVVPGPAMLAAGVMR